MTYVQLAHNVRDPQSGQPKANVLHTFGRSDDLDVAAIKRLTQSLCRFISPEDGVQAQAYADASLTFLKSVPMGGAYLLRSLWEMLGMHTVLKDCLKERSFTSPVEWATFAMAANRALAPDSKRGVEEWVREDSDGASSPDRIFFKRWACSTDHGAYARAAQHFKITQNTTTETDARHPNDPLKT